MPVPQNTEAAIAVYFETHLVPRENVEAAALEEGLSLGEYCQSMLVAEAVQTACAQFMGMAMSVRYPGSTPEELMQRSMAAAVEIWKHEIMNGLPIDRHVTQMLAATSDAVLQLTSQISQDLDKDD